MPWAAPRSDGDDVRRLAPDAGEPHEVVQPLGNLSPVLVQQHVHRPPEVPGLLPERSRRADVGLELLERHGEVVLGPAVLEEQLLRDAVHGHVRRLRGEHHRDEQLDRDRESGARWSRPGARARAARRSRGCARASARPGGAPRGRSYAAPEIAIRRWEYFPRVAQDRPRRDPLERRTTWVFALAVLTLILPPGASRCTAEPPSGGTWRSGWPGASPFSSRSARPAWR